MSTPKPALLYIVKFSEPVHHVIDIELWIDCQAWAEAKQAESHVGMSTASEANPLQSNTGQVDTGDSIKLMFPVWTPGSYLVREYNRNMESIAASRHDALGGPRHSELPLAREGKNRWHVLETGQAKFVCVTYRLYCREMSVRTNWVERDFAFLTGAATFPLVDGCQRAPLDLQLELSPGWQQVATSLAKLSSPANVDAASCAENVHCYAVSNFDELVDSPIVCGNFEVREFEVGGKQHYLANVNGDQLWDLDRAVADTKAIVAEHHRFWGEVPYPNYWFLNLATETRGGLEHDNSTVLMCSRWVMHRRETYLDWLALVSHEFFHTWNVRRLRPRELMQYDYEREQYFHELWIAEGVTSYFDDLALVRTGLCTRDEYLARLSKNVQTVQTSPGRLVQGLREASWDTWIKHYRPDENSPNARISYYLKGSLIAWLLDIELQKTSDGAVSLDVIMRLMWQRFRSTGYRLQDFEDLIAEQSSPGTRDWLQGAICEAEDLDFGPVLQWLGLQFKAEDSAKKTNYAKVWIGSQSTGSEGKLYVRGVLRGSPSDRAGLNVDDELIALDGYRLIPEIWPGHLEMFEPAQELELLVSRRGKIVPLKITLGNKPPHNWELAVDPGATPEARDRLNRWLRLNA
jgi:predicted metalloprotease with PDZ domain